MNATQKIVKIEDAIIMLEAIKVQLGPKLAEVAQLNDPIQNLAEERDKIQEGMKEYAEHKANHGDADRFEKMPHKKVRKFKLRPTHRARTSGE